MWRAFQTGTSGMKLNDAQKGIKHHVVPELYDELDRFIRGPRNQPAHRYIERVALIERRGMPYLAAAAGELIEVTQTANRLHEQIDERNEQIRATWPDHEKPRKKY
jgi:hypothetical protein